jgi:hypothetical protein
MTVVKTAMESDAARVIDALKLAFVADPATVWVWPDPQKYLSHFSSLAGMPHGFQTFFFYNTTESYMAISKTSDFLRGASELLVMEESTAATSDC